MRFLFSSVFDVLPTPTNMQKWRRTEDPFCAQCRRPIKETNILSSCQAKLTEGRFRRRHDGVLAQLADGLSKERKRKSPQAHTKGHCFISFLMPGGKGGQGD